MASKSSDPDFSAADGLGYLMDRSYLAACRLNYQHYLWKDSLKFIIHPTIPVPPKPIIADIAAGTAMWLIDIARELPEAQLEGFDIDLTQAPHPQWLPSNVTMRKWNIFEDVPDHLVGKFDIVHVRLIVLVMSQDDTRIVIPNLLKMLKPCGYLQWDDLNCRDMCVKKVDASAQSPALDQLRKMSWANGRHDWLLQLPQRMADEGLQDAELYHYGDSTDMIRAFNEQHLLTMDEFAASLLRIGKKEEAAAFYAIIKDSYQESLQGAALCIPRIVCVARKVI
ncbi:hypothetical protein MMC14_004426 [Varicellaria rhodocarpa]|nr:hypothetical protein [Varicellaria rhodocarpa]